MIGTLVAVALATMQPVADSNESDKCVSVQSTISALQKTHFQYSTIDDLGLVHALSNLLKDKFDNGLEDSTTTLVIMDMPDERTLILEFSAQGCRIAYGAIPTKAWHAILDGSQA